MAAVNLHSGTSDVYGLGSGGNWGTRVLVYTTAKVPYVVCRNSTTNGIEVWKGNTFPPASFSEQDSSNNPAGSTYSWVAAAIDKTGVIHIVYWDSNGKNSALRYVTFSTGTNTYSGNTSIYDIGNADPTYITVSIAVDANNIPHVCWTDSNSNMGSNYDTVYYGNKVGGSWNTSVEVEGQAAQKNCSWCAIDLDYLNRPVIGYINRTDAKFKYATSTSNNPSSFTLTATASTASTTAGTQKASVVCSGRKNYGAFIDSSGHVVIQKGATGAASSITAKLPSLCLKPGSAYEMGVLYVDTNDDIAYVEVSSGSFSTAVVKETGTYSFPNAARGGLIDHSYNSDRFLDLRNDGVEIDAMGQSFDGNGQVLNKVIFKLNRTGSPGGTLTAKLYAHSGTFGSSSVATGSALATSGTINASAVTTDAAGDEYTFTFSTPYTLAAGTSYVIVLDGDALTGTGASNKIGMRAMFGTGHDGNLVSRDNGSSSWTAQSAYDAYFRCITVTADLNYVFTGSNDVYWNYETVTSLPSSISENQTIAVTQGVTYSARTTQAQSVAMTEGQAYSSSVSANQSVAFTEGQNTSNAALADNQGVSFSEAQANAGAFTDDQGVVIVEGQSSNGTFSDGETGVFSEGDSLAAGLSQNESPSPSEGQIDAGLYTDGETISFTEGYSDDHPGGSTVNENQDISFTEGASYSAAYADSQTISVTEGQNTSNAATSETQAIAFTEGQDTSNAALTDSQGIAFTEGQANAGAFSDNQGVAIVEGQSSNGTFIDGETGVFSEGDSLSGVLVTNQNVGATDTNPADSALYADGETISFTEGYSDDHPGLPDTVTENEDISFTEGASYSAAFGDNQALVISEDMQGASVYGSGETPAFAEGQNNSGTLAVAELSVDIKQSEGKAALLAQNETPSVTETFVGYVALLEADNFGTFPTGGDKRELFGVFSTDQTIVISEGDGYVLLYNTGETIVITETNSNDGPTVSVEYPLSSSIINSGITKRGVQNSGLTHGVVGDGTTTIKNG